MADLILNILLVVVGASAFIVYYSQKRSRRRDAAVMIVLQIKEIRKNMIPLSQSIAQNSITPQTFLETSKVMNTNLWDEHKHILVQKVGAADAERLDDFYKCVGNVSDFQATIKSFLIEKLANNMRIYQQEYTKFYNMYSENPSCCENSIIDQSSEDASKASSSPGVHISKELGEAMNKFLIEFNGLNIDFAYSKLRKIAKIT